MRMPHLLLCLLCLPIASAASDTPTAEAIQKLLQREKYEQAIAALELVLDADAADGVTWSQLALATHQSGDYERAIEAGQQAVRFPSVRATSLYNLACSYSLSGNLDRAESSLLAALDDGFINYGLIEIDADLEALRQAGRLPKMPPALEYDVLRARNRLNVFYKVLLPDNFDQAREYPFVLAFAPGEYGKRDADWMIGELFSKGMGDQELVTVVVMAPDPKKGWMTHPSHHALEDLLKRIRKDYSVRDNRFHFFGYLSGHRPATTYSAMSGKYAAGLILTASSPFANWDDEDVLELAELPITVVAGSLDLVNRAAHRRLSELLGEQASFEFRTIEGEDHRLQSLRGERLVALLAEIAGAKIR